MTQSFHYRSCFHRLGFVDFSTVPITQSFHTRSCFHRLCSMPVCCKKSKTMGRQERWFVDFCTGPMTQRFHTRSCFHRLGFVDLSTVPMTQRFHTRSCIHRQCSMHVCCKIRRLWVNMGGGLLNLVTFPWPKVFILGLVYTAYVPCTYAVKHVNFGSTGAMVCRF